MKKKNVLSSREIGYYAEIIGNGKFYIIRVWFLNDSSYWKKYQKSELVLFFMINNFQKRSKSKEMGNLHIFNMSMRQGNEWEEFHTMGNIAILVFWLFFLKFFLRE